MAWTSVSCAIEPMCRWSLERGRRSRPRTRDVGGTDGSHPCPRLRSHVIPTCDSRRRLIVVSRPAGALAYYLGHNKDRETIRRMDSLAAPHLRSPNGFRRPSLTMRFWRQATRRVLTLALWFGVPNECSTYRAAAASAAIDTSRGQSATIRVWVNTASGVYHCPGTRYYGATKRGNYLSEEDARDQGYRAAGGRACGALTAPDQAPVPTAARGIMGSPGPLSSSMRVWVNTKSGVYHCPGTRYYGATKFGTYMTEAVARDSAYRPASGRTCG